jgi:hypothetical protein
MITGIAKFLYGFVGAVFVIGGAGVMLLHTGLLPGAATNILVEVAHGDPNTLHIIQEFGSLLGFAGLISFWFVRHYEQSKTYHWAMTTFWALFALAHWYGASGFAQYVRPATINTIPFVLFLAVGLLRKNSERET